MCAGSAKAPATDQAPYLVEVMGLQEKTWPENRRVNIISHGHSVPPGHFQTPVVDTFNAYPHLLHRKLKERFPHDHFFGCSHRVL